MMLLLQISLRTQSLSLALSFSLFVGHRLVGTVCGDLLSTLHLAYCDEEMMIGSPHTTLTRACSHPLDFFFFYLPFDVSERTLIHFAGRKRKRFFSLLLF